MEHERGPYYRRTQTPLTNQKVERFALPPRITGRRIMATPLPARPAAPTIMAVNMALPGAPETPGSRYYLNAPKPKPNGPTGL